MERYSDSKSDANLGLDCTNRTDLDTANWTRELSAGQLSLTDFQSLVKGKNDLAQMIALKEAGLRRTGGKRSHEKETYSGEK